MAGKEPDGNLVQQGYVTSEPYAIQKAGVKANAFLFGDFGFPAYATTVSCMDKTVKDRKAAVAAFVKGLGLSPFMLIVALIISYLILGCFLDGFSMIVMTLPIVLPIVKGAGFDEIWFGIFLVLAVEMAQITPPVGFNLFVIQGLTDDGLGYIARVTMPYLLIMVGFVLLLTLWPGIVTILPRVLYG